MPNVTMKALSVFANGQIVNKRKDAPRRDTVGIGDVFEAPWLVARDLARSGLAEAGDPAALDREPAEALDPHPSISAPDFRRINSRRQPSQRRDAGDERPAVTGFEMGAAVTGDGVKRQAEPDAADKPADATPKPPASPLTLTAAVKSQAEPDTADPASKPVDAALKPLAPPVAPATVKSNVPATPPAPADRPQA